MNIKGRACAGDVGDNVPAVLIGTVPQENESYDSGGWDLVTFSQLRSRRSSRSLEVDLVMHPVQDLLGRCSASARLVLGPRRAP